MQNYYYFIFSALNSTATNIILGIAINIDFVTINFLEQWIQHNF